MKENIAIVKALQDMQEAKDKAARLIVAEIKDIVDSYGGEFRVNGTLPIDAGEDPDCIYIVPQGLMLGSQEVGRLGADNIILLYRLLLDTISEIEADQ